MWASVPILSTEKPAYYLSETGPRPPGRPKDYKRGVIRSCQAPPVDVSEGLFSAPGKVYI